MYLTSLIHKGRTLNPTVVPAEEVLEMATINGAKCALLEKEIGSLEVGKSWYDYSKSRYNSLFTNA